MKGGKTPHITLLTPQPSRKPSFLQYVNAQKRNRQDEVCEFDFILDAKHDPKLKGVNSLAKLKSVMHQYNACNEAVLAACRVYKQYKQYLKITEKSG